MVAALRSEFGPLPDQSMHKKPVPHWSKKFMIFCVNWCNWVKWFV
jgi:hypothetical protein